MKVSKAPATDGCPYDSALENEGSGEPLSFNQEQLWFIHQLKGSVQYHIPVVLNVTGDLDLVVAEQAFRDILTRHHALRTVIRETDTHPRQYRINVDEWRLRVIDNNSDWSDPRVLQSKITEIISQ